MWHTVNLEDVDITGLLRERAERNFRRLQDPEFHFATTIKASTVKESPGDWVGRELLALTLYSRLFRTSRPQLDEFVGRLPDALNPRGYIGEIFPTGTAD